MGQSFSQQTLKVNAKMASSRLVMMRNKKTNALFQQQREIAELLANDKASLAEIKVESIIHEKDLIVASEILQLHSDRVLNRAAQIAAQTKCPEDVFQSIATIVYCSTRLPVAEFKGIAHQLVLKYSKEWVMPLNTQKKYVDPKVLELIDVAAPPRSRVIAELTAIAEQFQIDYTPPAHDVAKSDEKSGVISQAPDPVPSSAANEAALLRDLQELDEAHYNDEKSPIDDLDFPEVPSSDSQPRKSDGNVGPNDNDVGVPDPDLDELTRRFNNLSK